ncbi:GNAT family N-acetyltransferase [Pseudoflavitalea sp. G-6-1-2]|uniref:GNAT family N-acetyltransferase n=1 Tax=Pseudoflavitalea sp. G-6-1-2 TaxID=2728841 RepID=UPI00146F7167|nr:GNAT family N-acetyltransferase [Pseudoflavitalea sp. G-6-1-2]NML22341.1 GNAT family N-acetyltransferase [Pseudoflavitalea sp. G-6-1-2]
MYTISLITDADIAAVTTVINSAYEGKPGSKSWTSEGHLVEGQRTSESLLSDLIQKPGVRMYKCCDEQSTVLGCVLIEEKPETLYLGMLSVSPDAQAGGIGKLLLQFGENLAKENNYSTLTITVIDVRAELIDWYRRKGFAPTGNWEPFSNKSSSAKGDFGFMELQKQLQ